MSMSYAQIIFLFIFCCYCCATTFYIRWWVLSLISRYYLKHTDICITAKTMHLFTAVMLGNRTANLTMYNFIVMLYN